MNKRVFLQRWACGFVSVVCICLMAAKLSTYATLGSIDGDEKIVVTDDPSGTPATKNLVVDDLVTYAQTGYLPSIDEDNLVSDSAAHVPTQQSVKAYVDALPSGGGGGTVQGTDATYDIRAANEGATAGNARGENSVDLQTLRGVSTQVASGNRSTISGGYYNTNSAYGGAIGGGYNNSMDSHSSGSVIAGGNSNTIVDYTGSGATSMSTIGGGGTNKIENVSAAAIIGGEGNSITAGGYYASILGGNNNKATNYYAVASGQYANASLVGQHSQASGRFAILGDAQTSVLTAWKTTTNATPSELFLNGSSQRCTLSSDTTWAFTVTVVARRTDADNESAAYKFEGCIDNNAGTTSLVGSVTKTVLAEDTAAWDCDVTASDANDALTITVTGEAAKTIRWVARIELTEVGG